MVSSAPRSRHARVASLLASIVMLAGLLPAGVAAAPPSGSPTLLSPTDVTRDIWEAGRALPLERAVTEVVAALAEAVDGEHPASEAGPAGLTAREAEVLRLLVAGLTDREIGERLFVSPRTASRHVGAVLAKLGAASRTEAAALAVRDGLA